MELKRTGWGIDRVLTVILLIAIIVSVCLVVYVIVTPKQGEKFTEFYMLGINGMADEYPTKLTVGDAGTFIIGVVNHEYSDVSYRLYVTLNETIIHTEQIDLAHDETWEEPFTFKATVEGDNQKLEPLLYKEGSDEVYRSLHLWVNVASQE
ncbi:MAG: DUF1616 domain-containing protein [Methanosarcinales archaeon]|nr:MAG: DUF1616 domain-containing protein [Methanosarcinales archaeon]